MKKNLSLELIKEERKNSRIKKISELVKRAVADTFQAIDFQILMKIAFYFQFLMYRSLKMEKLLQLL